VWASDSSILVRTENALGLFRGLRGRELEGVCGLSPARHSVMIRFDPRRLRHGEVESWIQSVGDQGLVPEGRLVEIVTLYIGEDLEELAWSRGLSTSEVVEIHSGRDYDAWFLGFVPGFAYMGEVDERIAAPRRATPRTKVPAGSVGIAGRQTGVYPSSTPGGWNLIGVTDAAMFDLVNGRSRIEPGDRVRFVPR
jgi:KipI family sensor histidine kinase inhibitor